MNTFPPSLLAYTLSYLDLPDLLRSDRVCKPWKQTIAENKLVERFFLDNPKMWGVNRQQQLKMLWNWKFKEIVKIFLPPLDPAVRTERTGLPTLLADGSKYQVFGLHTPSFSFNVVDMATGRLRATHAPVKSVVDYCLQEHNLYTLNDDGSLLRFDIRTKTSKEPLLIPPPKGMAPISEGKIEACGDDILVFTDNALFLWDAPTNRFIRSYPFRSATKVTDLGSSKNHIYYKTNHYELLAFHKTNHKQATLHPSSFENISFEARGSYMATLESSAIEAYCDLDTALVKTKLFGGYEPPFSSLNGSLHIFQNWLVFGGDKHLLLFDMKQGTLLRKIEHGAPNLNCCLNGNQLLAWTLLPRNTVNLSRNQPVSSLLGESYAPFYYDLRPKVRKTRAKSGCKPS